MPASKHMRADGKQVIESVNPANGRIVGVSPLHTVEDAHEAVRRAREAQPAWAAIPVAQRSQHILRVRQYVVEHADELADTICRDNGKTRTDAMIAEVVPAAMAADYYAKRAPQFMADRSLSPGNPVLFNKRGKIVRVPYGVIGVISPWNYPFSIAFSEVVMALLAGNAVILKAASQTQLVGRALEAAFRAANLPPHVFSYLNMPGQVAGDALLEAGIDKLVFTGSVDVGKRLMAKAAETLTPLLLELGGNDAMLVCPDADLDRAAAGATWAGFQNCGQSCAGVERIYVHADVYEPFMQRLGERVRALRVGDGASFDVDLGSMTTRSQVETVRRHLADAIEKGAKIYAQSEVPAANGADGMFLPAVVLCDVDHTMDVMCHETFGPVVGVMKVSSMEQAIELANDSYLGLTGSVWSRNRKEAERLARRIRAGLVMINDHLMGHGLAEAPWGGFGLSGFGRTHGAIGFDEMTQPQCIVHDLLPGVRKDMWWHPHSKTVYEGVRGILDLLYGSGLKQRAQGLMKLGRVFPRTFRND